MTDTDLRRFAIDPPAYAHACTVMDGANADPTNPHPAVWVVYCLTCGPIAEHDYLGPAQDRAKVHGQCGATLDMGMPSDGLSVLVCQRDRGHLLAHRDQQGHTFSV